MIGARRPTTLVPAVCLAWIVSASAQGFPDLNADGWYAWRVAAATHHSTQCCSRRSASVAGVCDLDSDRLVTVCGNVEPAGHVQIYARIDRGSATAIRTLNPACDVQASHPIRDLGDIDVTTSIDWLSQWLAPDSTLVDEALFAVAAHTEDASIDALFDVVQHGRYDRSTREKALFWLAQSDSDEAFERIDALISGR